MKVGFVSLVGRPNVGKSTLLNALLNVKLAITSEKAGTTRNIIQGIYNDSDSQIIFVDTPGIKKPIHKLETVLNKKSYQSFDDVDIVLFLVDASTGIGRGDEFILKKLEQGNSKVYLLLNKIDKIPKEKLLSMIESAKDLYPFEEIIPISALKKDNLKDLLTCLKRDLEEGDPLFEEEELTNVSSRFLASEMVREKVLLLTHDEVPHSVTCYTETFEEEEDNLHISVLIVVDRENLKKIIIGKQGSMLKEIGTRARYDMERFFGKKVFLETYVKVIESWRDQERMLLELGLKDDDMV